MAFICLSLGQKSKTLTCGMHIICTYAKYNNAKNKKDMHNLGSGLFQHVVRIVWVSMNPKKLKRPVNPLRLRIKGKS